MLITSKMSKLMNTTEKQAISFIVFSHHSGLTDWTIAITLFFHIQAFQFLVNLFFELKNGWRFFVLEEEQRKNRSAVIEGKTRTYTDDQSVVRVRIGEMTLF